MSGGNSPWFSHISACFVTAFFADNLFSGSLYSKHPGSIKGSVSPYLSGHYVTQTHAEWGTLIQWMGFGHAHREGRR